MRDHTSPTHPRTEINPSGIGLATVIAAMVVACALLLYLQQRYWSWTADDSYITFRYAENLANGQGVVFNPGERVEGYTNFLWMLLLSGLFRIGADTVIAAKLLGAACALLTLLASAGVARHLSGGRWTAAAVAVPTLLASSPSFAAWSVAGLETALFTLLLTVAVWLFSVEQDAPSRFPWSGVLFALAGMTRPEGVLVFVLLFGLVVARSMQVPLDRTRMLRRGLLFLVAFSALALPYMAWRVSYFGYLLPNTFYVKGGRGVTQILAGILYVSAGIRKHGGILLHLVAFLPAIWGPYRRRASGFALAIAGWQAYNVYKGHDVLELFRFFVPILPILYAMSIVALVQLYEALPDRLPRVTLATAALALFVAGTVVTNMVMAYASQDPRPQLREYQLQIRIDDDEFIVYAKRLIAIAPPGSSIAVIDAGVVPYLTKWYTIDRWGLCDVHIAHSRGRGPLGEKFDEAYVLAKKPTFIQTKVTTKMERQGNPGWAGDTELFANSTFLQEYVRVPEPELDGFFVRTDVLRLLAAK
jgi:hypothetical protein